MEPPSQEEQQRFYSARPDMGDEEWQLSKDSADAATAFCSARIAKRIAFAHTSHEMKEIN